MDGGPIMDTFYSRQQMRPFRSKFDNETLRNVILAQFYVRNRSSFFFRGTYNACMESIDTQVFENRSKSLGKTSFVLCYFSAAPWDPSQDRSLVTLATFCNLVH